MSNSVASWTDLSSILESEEGKACFYGYLRSMDSWDNRPQRFHRHIELLDEVALFKQQADGTQKRADHILQTYVTPNSAAGGLWQAAPSAVEREKFEFQVSPHVFDPLEAAAREALTPFVRQFLEDVKRSGAAKSVKQRVKESGYQAFSEQLHGRRSRGGSGTCALC
ncbi:uncharacterized protein LOC119095295 [Pollicipes pollicipes]|uniref:uncharacterized protein LOC119095295 n=1 Tax=Pollicipes pollicipes TaxID=41117 RepID=UPI001884E73F|nr:uncharacterized protein LOC119095295 [Pollicipes pollicipes]